MASARRGGRGSPNTGQGIGLWSGRRSWRREGGDGVVGQWQSGETSQRRRLAAAKSLAVVVGRGGDSGEMSTGFGEKQG